MSGVNYIRKTTDNLENGIDLDLDNNKDIYASDVTAKVTIPVCVCSNNISKLINFISDICMFIT